MLPPISQRIASELGVSVRQVSATIELLESGSSVPFIARYRKEATGGLDDTQLRKLEERLRYLHDLEERRQTILNSVRDQGKLAPEIESQLQMADNKARLEDLYLPYKPKRRTKAQIAREAGLEPLADALFNDPTLDPEQEAASYVGGAQEIVDVKAALDGARAISIERFCEDAELVGNLRTLLWERGVMHAKQAEGKAETGAKFRDYFDFSEPIAKIPSHRALALFRGRKEEVLLLWLDLAEEIERGTPGICERRIAAHFGLADRGRPCDRWLLETAYRAWRTRMSLHLEAELMQRLWDKAESEAIRVFAANLRELLLAAPAGPKPTLGLDPGFRTGIKAAIVDATGKLTETAILYPHEPHRRWEESVVALAALCQRHKVQLVAIGNGTASRETDKLVLELMKRFPEIKLRKAMVSEAGASVYSACEYAAQEFPDLDVSLRGAVSIARRLQDPLAELVKIEPKAIGVGQYQHDVGEGKLSRSLDDTVEDCVNAVGVDLNTASIPLLARVSGLSQTQAKAIVARRDSQGPFTRRQHLLDVPRLGPKAFEQCAGFLKIMNGEDPLDACAVHPEAYPVVRRICAYTSQPVSGLIGNSAVLRALDPQEFTDSQFGLPTVRDILAELEKPGRDPRGEFTAANFRDGISEMKDLTPGMRLEGVVTNVTNFGAFVDIGVHQDGLVHVSALADRFVQDPHQVVKPGQIVQVKVLEVDLARKRIALTMRLTDAPTQSAKPAKPAPQSPKIVDNTPNNAPDNALAQALKRAALAKERKK